MKKPISRVLAMKWQIPKMMPLIQQLIKKQTQDWTPKLVIDPLQDRLLDIINTKKKALSLLVRG